ncbi:MAG: hypothetical protein K0R48_769 [Gammaproteobacteria bacterium]|jgi:hypothetical protein|nr:hypothetical protein [Gammaproteobacteria bacterium]
MLDMTRVGHKPEMKVSMLNRSIYYDLYLLERRAAREPPFYNKNAKLT